MAETRREVTAIKRELMLSGFDGFADNMPWPAYIEGQRMMLAAAMRLVGGNDGAGLVAYQYQIGLEDGAGVVAGIGHTERFSG